MVLADFVIEEILFIFKRFRAAHIFQQELGERRRNHVTFFTNQFNFRLATVVHRKCAHIFAELGNAIRLEIELENET